MKGQKAFTLIELLVVIAIIAILAAILFPVFAQAKASAKASVELSNAKQTTLAVIMYQGDVDDGYPVAGTINGAWATGYCNAQIGCPSWDKLIIPYTKNIQLLDSPLDRSQTVPTPFGPTKRSFRAAQNVIRGLTGFWWAPGDIPKPSLNGSAIARPSETILLTNQRNDIVYSGTWWPMSTWFENWVWATTAENTRPNNPAITSDTANDGTPDALGGGNNYWRGVDVSTANQFRVAMTDGSVRSRPAGFIFPGYLQRPNGNQPVNPAFRGVCLWVDQWGTNSANDCPIPQ